MKQFVFMVLFVIRVMWIPLCCKYCYLLWLYCFPPFVRSNCFWGTIRSSYQDPSTHTITPANTTLHPQVPAEVTTPRPAAALPAATTTLHRPSPVQLPLVARHPRPCLRFTTSTPLANLITWERSNPPPCQSPAAVWAQQRLLYTYLWVFPLLLYPVQQMTAQWRIHPWGPSWGRSRPLRRWITLPEPKGCTNCRRHRMLGWAQFSVPVGHLQYHEVYSHSKEVRDWSVLQDLTDWSLCTTFFMLQSQCNCM